MFFYNISHQTLYMYGVWGHGRHQTLYIYRVWGQRRHQTLSIHRVSRKQIENESKRQAEIQPGSPISGPQKLLRSVCYAILLPGWKSGFRAGFRPDSSRRSLKYHPSLAMLVLPEPGTGSPTGPGWRRPPGLFSHQPR